MAARGKPFRRVHVQRGQLLEIHAGPGVVLTVEKQERSGAVELRNAASGKLLRQWSPKEARSR